MRTTASELSTELRVKLLISVPTDHQSQVISYTSDQRGRLLIPYLRPVGPQEITHAGKPFACYPLSDAEVAANPKDGKCRCSKGKGCRLSRSPLAIARRGHHERLADRQQGMAA